MAIILHLETATTNCSVSIAKEGTVIALKERNSATYSHSEQLHEFIRDVIKKASLTLQDLNAVAVSKGPGSYTGLRIGVSAAKGLCFSLDLPLISVATLEGLARQITSREGYIIPLLDARRMEVYSAVFNKDHHQIRNTAAQTLNEDSFTEYAEQGLVHLVGSGAAKCKGLLRHPNFIFHEDAIPSAREMAPLAYSKYESGTFEDVAYYEPFYLKEFLLKTKKH